MAWWELIFIPKHCISWFSCSKTKFYNQAICHWSLINKSAVRNICNHKVSYNLAKSFYVLTWIKSKFTVIAQQCKKFIKVNNENIYCKHGTKVFQGEELLPSPTLNTPNPLVTGWINLPTWFIFIIYKWLTIS